MLPLVVQVLKYCTCPQLRPNFQEAPRCSLWALRPHIRQMWLKALLVILYKVQNLLLLLGILGILCVTMCYRTDYILGKNIIKDFGFYLQKRSKFVV